MSDDRTTADIEREIEVERGELARSLEELQSQFSPERIMNTATGYMRDNGGELASNVGRQIKENPLAAALTGIGVAWLIAGPLTRSSKPGSYDRWSFQHDQGHFPENFGEANGDAAQNRVAASGGDRVLDADEVPVGAMTRSTPVPRASTYATPAHQPRIAYDRRDDYASAPGHLRDPMGGFDERIARASGDYHEPSLWERARGHVDDIAGSLRDTFEDVSDSVRGKARSARTSVRSAGRSARAQASHAYHDAEYRMRDLHGPDVAGRAHAVRGRARGIKARAYARSSELKHRISEGTEHMTDAARDRVEQARQAAYEAQRYAEARWGEAAASSQYYYDRQPLVGGLIAFGVGAALGALLPRTDREDEMFGAYRDRAFDEAERVFREESRKAQAVAEAAYDEAKNVVNEKVEAAKAATPSGDEAVREAEAEATTAKDRVVGAAKDEADKQKLGSSLS